MTTYIIVVYIALLVLIKFRAKDTISRRLSLLYVSYWILSLLLCEFNPFGYYSVSKSSYWLLIGHLLAFVIGFVLVKPATRINVQKMQNISISKIVRNKLFMILYIICFCFILVLFYRQRMLVSLYTLGELRGDFMALILAKSGLSYLFYEIVGTGMFHFTLCLMSYMLLFERKWLIILMFFAYDVLWALVSGGRFQVITMGFYLLSMFILANFIMSVKNKRLSNYNLSYKAKLILVLSAFVLIVAMSAVTFMKHSTGQLNYEALMEGLSDLKMDFGEYSAGPIVAFDQGLKDPDIKPKKCQYGAATFCGADYFLYIMLRRFGVHETSSYEQTTHVFQEALMNISPDRGWNYAYTSCMYYYHDFGVWGVILLSFLFGIITRRIISRLYKSVDIYNIALFTFMCYCLYLSVFSGYTHKMVVLFYVSLLLVMSYMTRSRNKMRITQG